MRRLASAAALPLLILLSVSARADILVDNVNGLTLDEDGEIERFDGLLIGDDGRIEQVFDRRDKRPKNVDYRLDGKGRVLLPGLIDAHVDLMELGFAQLGLDLSGTRSLGEALARLKAYAAAHPDRPWILGRGWNERAWGLDRMPTAAELDGAISDRPVWLIHADGHSGWANSAALAAGGVDADLKAPPGGRIERLADSKAPSGVLAEAAMALVGTKVPRPRPEDRDLALLEAQRVLLRTGVTTVTDMGTSIENWQAYRRAGDLGRLRVRILAYAGTVNEMALIGGPKPTPWLYDDRLRLNGVTLDLDGALGSRGALLKAPYADDPANGLARISETQLKNLMSRGAIDNFQVAVRASGDAAASQVLDAIADLSETYSGERRWRIELAHAIDPAELARFGEHGLALSMRPSQIVSDQQLLTARLGETRLAGVHAWRSVTDAGATLAFGSGEASAPPAPFADMATATTRQDKTGQPFGGWQPQERLDREEALAAYTTGAAYAGYADGRLGRIAKGFRADFILVDRDPMIATPDELRNIRVLQTWVGGKPVYEAKDPPRSTAEDE